MCSASAYRKTAGGMGLALARHLLSQGWRVGMSDVDKQRGEAMEAELGEDAVFVAADVTDYDQQASLFETVWAKWKRIDFGKIS